MLPVHECVFSVSPVYYSIRVLLWRSSAEISAGHSARYNCRLWHVVLRVSLVVIVARERCEQQPREISGFLVGGSIILEYLYASAFRSLKHCAEVSRQSVRNAGRAVVRQVIADRVVFYRWSYHSSPEMRVYGFRLLPC